MKRGARRQGRAWFDKGTVKEERAARLEDEVEAGHLVDDERLEPEEEHGQVVHPLQHGRDRRDVHQVAREQQAQQQHLPNQAPIR